ncbi:hypothetical protein WA026_016625 [Henosepilachna vigintioctopunctata]|uniref:BAT2 N-terminal domain-containing protein n=1 Tax=Henosepilachna vigintioctopunctata TaxID=420089 RepID=A0AAW1VHS3_9CUCU
MSTLSGSGSKGEKQKAKYQSLDINKIYRGSRGESSEKTQQKSTTIYKHGMQILGKVPNTRRPPANLPSLKSEHSGNEAAVPLVPPGGPGWGKQDSTSTPNGLPLAKMDSHQTSTPPSHQAVPPSQIVPVKQELPHVPNAPIDKSWSSVMSRGDSHSHHPPPYQGPQFQHDFPSLSAADGNQGRSAGTEGTYSMGLSLRPQTEGTWVGCGPGAGGEGKISSGHLGAPPQLSVPAGLVQQQQQTIPPQYRGVMPSFMFKNSPPQTNNLPMKSQGQLITHEIMGRQEKPLFNSSKKNYDDVIPPSIIKEEELHRMDEIERDMGWAYSDDIDYNKKLSFSDDELLSDKNSKPKQNCEFKVNERSPEIPKRDASDAWQTSNKGHSSEEDEIKIKRNQHNREVEIAVQRAKQRKKEEEKRFNEATKQGAKQKLKALEERISKREHEEGIGTINPSLVPPKPIVPTEIPLPDFQKEKDGSLKDKEERVKITNDVCDDKIEKASNNFKQLTEIEGKTSLRKNAKPLEREPRDQGVPSFSRNFQNNLPPRFKRQQNVQLQFTDHFENRSANPQNYLKHNAKKVSLSSPLSDNEPKKLNLDDPSPNSYISSDLTRKTESSYSNDNYEFEVTKHAKEEVLYEERVDKREFEKKEYDKKDYIPPKRNENVSVDSKTKNTRGQDSIYDRFQRLDSQESKISRDSKYSSDVDNREYSSWAESKFDIAFEERRRECPREDRRQVPGPITRDRIEADDINESRNLTALKRGQMPEKKIIEPRSKDEKNSDNSDVKNFETCESKVWSDHSDKSKTIPKKEEKDNKATDNSKKNQKVDDYRDDKRNSTRVKQYPQNKGWNEYHRINERGNWQKRSNSMNKNTRPNVTHKSDSFGGVVATDSEGSSEEPHQSNDQSQKNGKSEKDRTSKYNSLKDDKKNSRTDKEKHNEKSQDLKRENYVPRGEPSRHGRGGGNFRSRVGLSKRIDGYGPPPSKSPFTHHEDKKSVDYDGNSLLNPNNLTGAEKDLLVEPKNDEKLLGVETKSVEDRDFKNKTNKNGVNLKQSSGSLNTNASKKANQQGRSLNDKKPFGIKSESSNSLQSKQSKPDESNLLCSAIADISLKNKEDLVDDVEEEISIHGDSDGFQEVKSKKTVKERPKTDDKVTPAFPGKIVKPDNKDREKIKKPLPLQPTHNIPPLMATLVNPPHILPVTNKNQFDRQNRQNKIPPRFAKLRENNRLQKMQQQHSMVEMNDLKSRNMFTSKIVPTNNPVPPISNAWDKPLGTQLRPMENDNVLVTNLDGVNNMEHTSTAGDADADKKINKPPNIPDSAVLDGATAPVNTIIFENTNFKSVPTNRSIRSDKLRKEENTLESQTISNFAKPLNDLLNKNDKQSDSIQLQLPFKEDGGDMKLDFFDSDLTLTDEKALKNPCLSRSMHSMGTAGNNISTADALNFKIQSVKKVWETPSEHSVPQEDANNSFSSSFATDPNTLDSSSFVKGNDNVEDNHEQHGYSQATNQQTSNTTNVCKVKPTQQVSGASSQTVSSTSGAHPPHSGMIGPGLMGNPLSPPPIQPVIGAGVGIGQPPQQYPTNQHIGYQTGLGSSSQYGMSTIPSPPTVLPYTAPPLQAQTANLYGPFQIDQAGVLGQGRSQFSQYPNHYGLGQAASSPYSAQSMFLQTAQGHPPAAQGPEIYQNLNNYRLSSGPFGQNQQLNNPTTVLISSTSNSLMSASVKPSTQQISAIGTKSGGVGQAYQQQSQQGQQVYMFDPSIPANYLQSPGVLQRPTGPVQNNVVPTIQPSSSYYSGSTGTAKPFNCPWRF